MTTLTITVRKIQNINHRDVVSYKLTLEPIWCPELAAHIPELVVGAESQQGRKCPRSIRPSVLSWQKPSCPESAEPVSKGQEARPEASARTGNR